tara:strand:+ start:285 stop:1106 length:822 start_codon:yes stop_codon:yes gene_type:complete
MAVAFDGVNQYFKTTSTLFSGTSGTDFDITFVCWARPDNRHTGYIMAADNGSSYADGWALYTVSGGKFRVLYESSYITGTTVYLNGNANWFHVAGVWQYGTRSLYVNGTSEATNTSNRTMVLDNADNFYLGNHRLDTEFQGKIAECAAYSVSLTAAEIATLAAGFSPLFVRPDKLVGYWPLGGPFTAATSGADITGTDGDLTAYNSPVEFDHPYLVWPTAHQNIIYPLAPAAIIPGQGHDYALPGNVLDYSSNSQSDYTTPRQAADYGVPDGT